MSWRPEGPGWWRASDGRWYPPELHPNARPVTPAPDWSHPAPDGPRSGTGAEGGPASTPSAGWQYGWDPWRPGDAGPAAGTPPAWPDTRLLPPAGGQSGTGPPWPGPYVVPPPPKPPRRRRLHPAVAAAAVGLLVALCLIPIPVVLLRAHHASVPRAGFVDPVPQAPSAATGSLLSPAVTTEVVDEVWPAFAGVAATAPASQLATLASANVVDLMLSRQLCGCGSWPATYSSLEVTAPPERSYPLSFLAEIDQSDDPLGPAVEMAVFAKGSPSAPWLITHLVGWGGTNQELTQPASLDAPAPAPTLSEPFVQLADLLASLRRTGEAPPGNAWDSTVGGDPHDQPTNTENVLTELHGDDVSSGLAASARFTVGDYSPPFWSGDSVLACATIWSDVVVRSSAGAGVVQPASQSDFSPQVPPGTYSSVTEQGVYEVCLDQYSAEQTDVVGLQGDNYLVTGVPAS